MPSLRAYGRAPYTVALIHGGPGAPGSMAAVARELETTFGVLEPLQSAASLEGQVEELRAVLAAHTDRPVTLVGWSWGAMLSFIFAARHARYVKKLVLVSSGVYETRYAPAIMATRLSRLSGDEQRDIVATMNALETLDSRAQDAALARIGALFTAKADSYDAVSGDDEVLEVSYAIHRSVWDDASALRSSGALLALGRQITCPVVAIHGDYDPHPVEGVRAPLERVLAQFTLHVLPRCGHYPWLERHARSAFFELLKGALT